nr:hypothetical protein [Bradyrhizobium zhanjiangense]
MADAAEVFKRGMIEADHLRAEQAEAEARALHQRRTELLQLASRFESAVEEQGAATREISRNIQHAAQGTEQVAPSIVDV